MTRSSDAARLVSLAQVMLDHRLSQLRSVTSDLERSRAQLAALDQSDRFADLDPVTAGKVALAYDLWADQRRAGLNLVIARQTVAQMDARSEAKTAFGRVQALQGLVGRLRQA